MWGDIYLIVFFIGIFLIISDIEHLFMYLWLICMSYYEKCPCKSFCCCCSVTKSCPTLCDPMNYSRSGFPVLHYLSEFAQTHVHWVSDAIQPSNSLSPLLLLPSIFPSIKVFSNESNLQIRWLKYWSFSFSISPSSEYSGLISFRIDWFDLLTVQYPLLIAKSSDLSLLLILLFCYWVAAAVEFLTHFGYQLLIRHMIYKYFPPFNRLLFHSVDCALWRAEMFQFDATTLVYFLLLLPTPLVSYPKIYC